MNFKGIIVRTADGQWSLRYESPTVTAKVQRAIESGHRSRMIDADDLVEVLLAVADELDPPTSRAQTKQPARRKRGRRTNRGR